MTICVFFFSLLSFDININRSKITNGGKIEGAEELMELKGLHKWLTSSSHRYTQQDLLSFVQPLHSQHKLVPKHVQSYNYKNYFWLFIVFYNIFRLSKEWMFNTLENIFIPNFHKNQLLNSFSWPFNTFPRDQGNSNHYGVIFALPKYVL